MKGLLAFAQPRPLGGLVAIWIGIALFSTLAAGGVPDFGRVLLLCAVFFPLNVFATIHNDLCDLDLDRQSQPTKPLVRGDVSEGTARIAAWSGAVVGLVVSALIHPYFGLASQALLLLAFWHDRGAKRSLWSAAPSLLSAATIPLWVWTGYGSWTNGERWFAGALLAILLFGPIYLLTTLWDYDEANTTDLAHRLGRRASFGISWVVLWASLLGIAASTLWVSYELSLLAGALGFGAVLLLVSMFLSRTRVQLASIVAGAASVVLLFGWMGAIRGL